MQSGLSHHQAAPPPRPSPTRGEGADRRSIAPLPHKGGGSRQALHRSPPPCGEGLGVGCCRECRPEGIVLQCTHAACASRSIRSACAGSSMSTFSYSPHGAKRNAGVASGPPSPDFAAAPSGLRSLTLHMLHEIFNGPAGAASDCALIHLGVRRPRASSRGWGFFSLWIDRNAAIRLSGLPLRSCSDGSSAQELAPSLRWRAC